MNVSLFADRNHLLKKIQLGEDSRLEFKEVVLKNDKIIGPKQNVLADEVAAFANTAGGLLLLGVQDHTRKIVGIPIEHLNAVGDLLLQVCKDSLEPPCYIHTENITLPDERKEEQPVIVVSIPRSLFVHKSPSGYLHRIGPSKSQMSPSYLAKLFQERSQR